MLLLGKLVHKWCLSYEVHVVAAKHQLLGKPHSKLVIFLFCHKALLHAQWFPTLAESLQCKRWSAIVRKGTNPNNFTLQYMSILCNWHLQCHSLWILYQNWSVKSIPSRMVHEVDVPFLSLKWYSRCKE